jgi:toxin YoeB
MVDLGGQFSNHWQQQDKKILQRINELIKDTLRSPFKGIGKPEPPDYR